MFHTMPRAQRRALQRCVRSHLRSAAARQRSGIARRRFASSSSGNSSGSNGDKLAEAEELLRQMSDNTNRVRSSMVASYGGTGARTAARDAEAAGSSGARAAAGEGSAAASGAGESAAAGAQAEAAEGVKESIAQRTLTQQPRFGGGLGTRATAGRKVRGYLAGADGGEAPAIAPFMMAFAAVLGVSVFLLYRTFGTIPFMPSEKVHVEDAGKVLDTPLFEGNPVVWMDIDINGAHAGRIIMQLRSDVAPLTAENFRALCTNERGFGYKGTRFHRVVEGHLAQGGDFVTQDGRGSASIYGTTFPDESFDLAHKGPGVLSMANAGRPHTNGCQFFLTTARAPYLNNKYVAFGNVIDGMDVVEKIDKYGQPNGQVSANITVSDCGQYVLPASMSKAFRSTRVVKGSEAASK